MNGILILNKPMGRTSREAVDCAQHWFPRTRLGHAGTLDPLATGVLVLCIGQATRLVEHIQAMQKTYVVDIQLGGTSDTDDAEGVISPVHVAQQPTLDELKDSLQRFIGEIQQTPPAFSAVKVQGKRAHKLARRGETPALTAKTVTIYGIELIDYNYPMASARIECGKGVYIRSLARDVGHSLGCGGYVKSLSRTRIGPFRLEVAVNLDSSSEKVAGNILPMRAALSGFPHCSLDNEALEKLSQGQAIRLDCPAGPGGTTVVLDSSQELAALADWDSDTRLLRPRKVFRARGK